MDAANREFGKTYSLRGVSKLMKRMEMSYAKPTYILVAVDRIIFYR
ncbi:winged helix-turn-helix domain-containing protein [Paenibacillus mesophilus]